MYLCCTNVPQHTWVSYMEQTLVDSCGGFRATLSASKKRQTSCGAVDWAAGTICWWDLVWFTGTHGDVMIQDLWVFSSHGDSPKKNCDVISKLIWTKYIMAIGQPCGCPLLVLNRSEKHDPNSVDLSGTCLGPETWREAEFGMNENLPNTYRRPWDYLSHPPSRKMNIYSEMMLNKYIYIP